MYTREFKITMKVSLPISSEYSCDEDTITTLVESALNDSGMNAEIWEVDEVPLEYVHKDYYGEDLNPEDDPEDITKFPDATGYICPDGKFYGGSAEYDSFMHVAIAKEVWKAYKDSIDTSLCTHSSTGLDYDLERWGFIKIRDGEICYYVPPVREGKITYWTDAQRETVLRYMKFFEKYHKDCNAYVMFSDACGHKTSIPASKFAQMDKFAIIKCFDFSERLK